MSKNAQMRLQQARKRGRRFNILHACDRLRVSKLAFSDLRQRIKRERDQTKKYIESLGDDPHDFASDEAHFYNELIDSMLGGAVLVAMSHITSVTAELEKWYGLLSASEQSRVGFAKKPHCARALNVKYEDKLEVPQVWHLGNWFKHRDESSDSWDVIAKDQDHRSFRTVSGLIGYGHSDPGREGLTALLKQVEVSPKRLSKQLQRALFDWSSEIERRIRSLG